MILQPVLNVVSRQWMLGKIEDHTAIPLTREEIEAVIQKLEELEADRARLNWLIKGGYVPANWRAWVPADGPASLFANGQVMTSHGDRETIDRCMHRKLEAKQG